MKALIIDFTNNQDIKILNTRITSGVSIISGYYITVSPRDDPIEIAASKLRLEKLIDIPAYIIPPRDFVQTQIFHFPPMPDKDIKKVLPREIASVRDLKETIIYNYLKNGIVREKLVDKLEIAAFFSTRKNTFEFLNKLKSEGINPTKIIPEIQGLKSLIETNKELHGERSGVVFLDLMESRINLNMFKSQYWSLDREFGFQFEKSDEFHGEDLSRISIELNRTFQYFKQRNRTYDVDKVILYGSNPNIKHLKEFISENHAVSAEIINPVHFKGKISYPHNLKDREEFILIFCMAISVSVSMTRKKVLNLFPEEYTEKEILPRRLLGLGISAAVITVILTGSTIYFERVKNSYKQDIEGTKKTYLSLSKNAIAIENTKKMRANYFKKRFFTEIPVRYSYGATNFVRRLSLIAGKDIKFVKLEIEPLIQDFSFTLNGRIIVDDNIDALAKYHEFFRKLKAFEDMVQINFSTIKVSTGEITGTPPPFRDLSSFKETRRKDQSQVELFFTITGRIELE